MRFRLLAFFSGLPALAYELVWSREVALAAGAQVEAVATVLAAYFTGLAAGARWLGPRADRVRSPLAFYAALEVGAALLAAASILAVRAVAAGGLLALPGPARLALLGAVLVPTTFLLGGTLPALLCAAERDARRAARTAGGLVGANTAGAALGVVAAAAAIPTLGLRATLLGAVASALAAASVAARLARQAAAPAPPADALPAATGRLAALPIGAAAVAGVSTLAFEVIVTRMLTLRVGSSLFAFAAVLVLFLLGLALGNLALAPRAARTARPLRDLAVVELLAALGMVGAASWVRPELARSAAGLSLGLLPSLLAGVLAPAFFLGAAFPFFVRGAVGRAGDLGRALGRVSAWNTAGGVAGSLAAPFLLLPALGLPGAVLACAALNAGLAALLLGVAQPARTAAPAAAVALLVCGLAAGPALRPEGPAPGVHVLFVEHGRQATTVVARTPHQRDLLVDGDPEASTAPGARITEELLAVLPLVFHPAPRSLLEVGFGSGISLGAAARFPLDEIECVEIAASVLRAGRFFVPENREVLSGRDGRIRVVHGDGRAHLLRRPGRYDVVLANTVHPWSVGATGLYSEEYFARIARSLRPGGIAAQWLPAARIGPRDFDALLRTFFHVFPEGRVYWGSGNLLLLGSAAPFSPPPAARVSERLEAAGLAPERWGIRGASGLAARRLADAAAVRALVGPGPVLSDDRPALEAGSLRGPRSGPDAALLERVAALARAGGAAPALRLWIESRVAEARGDRDRALALENRVEALGLGLGSDARVQRALKAAAGAWVEGDPELAEARLTALIRETGDPRARFAVAEQRHERGDLAGAEAELRALVSRAPDHAPAWNLLGVIHAARGEGRAAEAALERALVADPFLPEALANRGLLAAGVGDAVTARRMVEALREISPLGRSELLVRLEAVVAGPG